MFGHEETEFIGKTLYTTKKKNPVNPVDPRPIKNKKEFCLIEYIFGRRFTGLAG